jgi:putative ABC transport system ATP-binding protein
MSEAAATLPATARAVPVAAVAVSANPLIGMQGVPKTYDAGELAVQALRGIDLEIEKGQMVAIIGPSGSGKSTLMHILGCLDRPTSGRYLLDGHDVSQMTDNQLSDYRLRRLGFVFQSFHLIPQLTVRENIELPLFYLGWEAERSAARAKELAERVGLEHRLQHRPSELSGGQQQRVAIARSLANDPAIIMADEPTGNLDSATGEQIMGLLRELNDQGKTIIMVTHEPDIAAYARQRVHLRDGRIERMEG